MKTKLLLSTLSVSALFAVSAQPSPQTDTADSNLSSATNPLATTDYAVLERDGDQKVWSKVTFETNAMTSQVTAKTNSYIELATASAHLVNGAWIDFSDQIQITKTGAQATNSQHRVEFLANINSAGSIDLTF